MHSLPFFNIVSRRRSQMKVVVFLIFFVIDATTQKKLSWRIIGGYRAEIGSYPFHVSLRVRGKHDCSGSIINPKVILTAAHCIFLIGPEDVVVVAGSNYLDKGGEYYDVEKITFHENFNISIMQHDVGLLKVSRPIKFNRWIKPIRLETKYVGENVECILSGFGMNSFPNGNVTNQLQHTHLTTTSNRVCKNLLEPSLTFPTQVCTLSRRGLGTCKGDSGGPLISNGKQIGIVSWGRSCALGYPDVFTRVSEYLNWIIFNI